MLYLLGIILFTVIIKLPYINVPLDADYGIYGYHGLFWLRKQKMPVKDTKENHPPGRWLLYSGLLKIFGVSRAIFRYSAIFFLVLTQVSIFIILNQLIGSLPALLASLVYGIMVSLPTFVWVQSNDEIEQSAFTALAIALIVLSIQGGSWLVFLAGIVTFLSLFFKQSAYVNTIPPVAIALFLLNCSMANILLFSAGLLIGLALTGYYHYKKEMFSLFLEIFSLNINSLKMHLDNILYGNKQLYQYHEYDGYIPPENKAHIDQENQGFQDRQKRWARRLYLKFIKQTMFLTLFIPFIFFADHFMPGIQVSIIFIAWILFSGIAIYINKHIMPYHFLPVAAPLSILAGIGLVGIWHLFELYSIGVIPIIVGVGLLAAISEIQEINKREKIQRGLMYINDPNEWLFFTIGEKIGQSIQSATTSVDKIYVWGAQYEIYLWAERSSPTWSLFCPNPTVGGYVVTPFLDEDLILKDLVPDSPKYIVIAAATKGFKRFEDYLEKNYIRVEGKDEEIQIYRWIFADILSNDETEARKRQETLRKIDNYISAGKNKETTIQSLLNEGIKKKKINKLEKVREINPFHNQSNEILSDLYQEKGDVKNLMKCLHYLYMENRENSFVTKKLGDICLYNEKYDQAEKLYQKSRLNDSLDMNVVKNIGISLFHQQKYSEAEHYLVNYLKTKDKDIAVMEILMNIYWEMDRKSEAQFFANQLINKEINNKRLHQKIKEIKSISLAPVDRPAHDIGIVWEGPQFQYQSLALVNREQSVRLAEKGYNLSILSYGKDQFPAKERWEFLKQLKNRNLKHVDIHLRHQWPPKLRAPKTGHWVVIQPWEFGSLPKKWVERFNKEVDEMWVPSNYVRDVYIDSGIDDERVFVVPNGVDTEKFNPDVKPYQLKTKKSFKFLFVGGTIYRKGIDLLLESYSTAFEKSDDVCLVIKDFGGKSFYKNQNFEKKISGILKDKNAPEIEYINDTLSEEMLIGLYTACDCLVHPYRGEGFGLPIMEAMACGLPTIVTRGGAAMDFCNDQTSLFADAKKITHKADIISGNKLVDNAWFWEVDQNDLAKKMTYATQHQSIIEKMGQYAANYVHKNWRWDIINLLVDSRIQKVIKKPIVRFQKEIIEVINSINAIENEDHGQDLLTAYLEDYKQTELGTKLLGAVLVAQKMQHFEIMRKYIPILEKIYADNSMVLNLIGIINFEMENFDHAEDLFKRSLAYNSDSVDTRRNYAESCIITENYEEGINQFLEVIKRKPEDIMALLRMAEFCVATDRKEDANNYLERVLTIDPQNDMALQLKNSF